MVIVQRTGRGHPHVTGSDSCCREARPQRELDLADEAWKLVMLRLSQQSTQQRPRATRRSSRKAA